MVFNIIIGEDPVRKRNIFGFCRPYKACEHDSLPLTKLFKVLDASSITIAFIKGTKELHNNECSLVNCSDRDEITISSVIQGV